MSGPRPLCGVEHAVLPPYIGVATDAPPAHDPVHRPAHYTQGGIEAVDAIEAALTGETDPVVAWCRGNALKYLWRAGKKGDAAEDLRKAIWYADRAAARLERRAAP